MPGIRRDGLPVRWRWTPLRAGWLLGASRSGVWRGLAVVMGVQAAVYLTFVKADGAWRIIGKAFHTDVR